MGGTTGQYQLRWWQKLQSQKPSEIGKKSGRHISPIPTEVVAEAPKPKTFVNRKKNWGGTTPQYQVWWWQRLQSQKPFKIEKNHNKRLKLLKRDWIPKFPQPFAQKMQGCTYSASGFWSLASLLQFLRFSEMMSFTVLLGNYWLQIITRYIITFVTSPITPL